MRTIRSDWSGAVLVCGKCSKKLDGGFGPKGRTSLAKALRKLLGGGRKRKAAFGVIETKCFGVCPKGAVVMVDTARPGEWMLVPKGADAEEVTRSLGGR